jgi:hypothetical protein
LTPDTHAHAHAHLDLRPWRCLQRPGAAASTRQLPPAAPQQREAEGPGAPSSSSEEDPPGRQVPGGTPLECPLGRDLAGLHSPGRWPARLATRTARGSTNRKRPGGGGAAAAELPAPLPRMSPAEVTGACRRGCGPALDGSCAGVREGRSRDPAGKVAAGATGAASSMWMSCRSLGQAQPCTGQDRGGGRMARSGSSMIMSSPAGSISSSACRSGAAGPARIHVGRGCASGITGGVGGGGLGA